MPQEGQHRVQLGLEVTPGTPVVAAMDVPLIENGFRHTQVNHVGEVVASSTFPYRTTAVPVGVTSSSSVRVDLNRDNIRDIILLTTKRTANALPTVTIIDDQYGVGVSRFSGCAVRELRLGFTRGATPGPENILTAELQFEHMLAEDGQGAIAALTASNASRFQFRHSTVDINAVAAVALQQWSLTIKNLLALGPVEDDNKRAYIGFGLETHDYSAMARFATTAWRALVEGSTEALDSDFILGTGTANETVTGAIGKGQITTREIGEADKEVTEQISIDPYHTGAAAPIVPAWGTAIGASVLGL